MKKIFAIMLMACGFICSVNAQMIVEKTPSCVKVDINNDGIWDTEINVSRVPHKGYMMVNHSLANELGRCYVVNLWRLYEAQGVNPVSYGLPDPGSDANFTQYATAYSHLISYSGAMGMVGGIGLPGTASVGVQIGKVGVGVNIPVTNANNGLGGILTPNATIGVNVNGNGGMISLPVGVKVNGKKSSRRQSATTVPATQQKTRVATTPTTPNKDSVEMSVDEIQSMLNGEYM